MATAYIRRQFNGAAVKTTLTGSTLSSSGTTFSIALATGWPDGSVGPFIVCINRGNATEEKILVNSRSGLTCTTVLAQRGYDGTSAAQHVVGETVEIVGGAQDLDEANQAVVQTLGAVAAKGDLLAGSAANTLSKLGVGSNTQILTADSTQATGMKWAAPATQTATGTAGGDLTGTYPNPTLAAIGSATGPIGDGTHVSTVTIDTKGRVTALTSTSISFPSSAMVQLARSVLGGAGTFSFTSISGSYNSLVIRGLVRSSLAANSDSLSIRFNNDSGANYQFQTVTGISTTAGASAVAGATSINFSGIAANSATAGYATAIEIVIPEYAATTFFKSCALTCGFSAGASTSELAAVVGGSWANTAAITRVDIGAGTALGTNFLTGSTFTLYGVN